MFMTLGVGAMTIGIAVAALFEANELSAAHHSSKMLLDKLLIKESQEKAKNAQLLLAIEKLNGNEANKDDKNNDTQPLVDFSDKDSASWKSEKYQEMRRKQEAIRQRLANAG
eukprot:TRINITY_DN836_c0_g1_i2.p1 TRINITY_DN836_c0_g1~~TRINITY_DN836_c0_g1_i2.p1  ORF type:complete len:112 (+),score=24.53 TRINITY_DN836_c0_g1_i2:507-842(+)